MNKIYNSEAANVLKREASNKKPINNSDPSVMIVGSAVCGIGWLISFQTGKKAFLPETFGSGLCSSKSLIVSLQLHVSLFPDLKCHDRRGSISGFVK